MRSRRKVINIQLQLGVEDAWSEGGVPTGFAIRGYVQLMKQSEVCTLERFPCYKTDAAVDHCLFTVGFESPYLESYAA